MPAAKIHTTQHPFPKTFAMASQTIEKDQVHDEPADVEQSAANTPLQGSITDSKEAVSAPSPAGQDPKAFPDGGWEAWLVVLGGFCAAFASFGWVNCVGIFQDYYASNFLSSYSPSTVAWIPSTQSFMMFFWGPVVGKLYDFYGPRVPLVFGACLHVFGLFMTSISKEYYQVFLSQSITSAIGCSFLFYPCMTAASSWFLRHRALAIGIMASGSSIGGVVLPIMVHRLIRDSGFGWAMRAVAFLVLGLCIFACLTVKSRLPPSKTPLVLKEFVAPYAEVPFILLTIGARAQGMSDGLATYMISILNASSTFGRIIPAHFGDLFGVFNVMIGVNTFGAAVILAFWLPSTVSGNTNALTIVFAIFYGFASGCIFSIIPAMIARISPDLSKLGVRTGSLYAISATGVLIGSPIAGVIASGSGNGFLHLTIFSGVLMMAGTAFIILSRVKQTGLRVMVKA
ncbi:MFS general substrate transporter [Periconia macrospinosa]|uniref:MFS general substrate transporter n=1 Tax=Periconia macrospinosa TaxID=97972 RepID=A0A2V1E1Y3_9PLEO|nr:MFS general substrate transporter [Periconia macrospinosa]